MPEGRDIPCERTGMQPREEPARGYPADRGSVGTLGEPPKQLGAGACCGPRPEGVNTIFWGANAFHTPLTQFPPAHSPGMGFWCPPRRTPYNSFLSGDRSRVQGTGRRRWAHAGSRKRTGDRLSLRSAAEEAIANRWLPAWPRQLRRLLRFLFRPPR